jgi:hypothetical protein
MALLSDNGTSSRNSRLIVCSDTEANVHGMFRAFSKLSGKVKGFGADV